MIEYLYSFILYTEYYRVSGISKTYSDTDKGELLALINSSDYLEIAVNPGKASEYMRKAADEIIGMRVKGDRIN